MRKSIKISDSLRYSWKPIKNTKCGKENAKQIIRKQQKSIKNIE